MYGKHYQKLLKKVQATACALIKSCHNGTAKQTAKGKFTHFSTVVPSKFC